MSIISSPAALPKYIETLLSQRTSLVASLASIDATLSRVTAAIGGTASSSASASAAVSRKTPGRKPGATKMLAAATGTKSSAANGRAKSGLTANEFVLEFIRTRKNPTSQEINKHWTGAGRKGTADNSLSLLTKGKHLKRIALGGGQRGSRYSVV